MKKDRSPDSPGQINQSPTAKKGPVGMILPQNPEERIEVMVMFRILSRRSWDRLQAWHQSCPGSTIEHLYAGLYVLAIPAGGACEEPA